VTWRVCRPVTIVNVVQAPKRVMQELTRRESRESRSRWEGRANISSILPGYWRRHADKGDQTQHGSPAVIAVGINPATRESQAAVWGGGEARSTDEAGNAGETAEGEATYHTGERAGEAYWGGLGLGGAAGGGTYIHAGTERGPGEGADRDGRRLGCQGDGEG